MKDQAGRLDRPMSAVIPGRPHCGISRSLFDQLRAASHRDEICVTRTGDPSVRLPIERADWLTIIMHQAPGGIATAAASLALRRRISCI
jgi:hypothetical protein